MSRNLYPPYDLVGATVSTYSPQDPDYIEDCSEFGIDPTGGLHFVAIGAEPDIILTGTHEQLVNIFEEGLSKLGG